jgi:hypothetical protein
MKEEKAEGTKQKAVKRPVRSASCFLSLFIPHPSALIPAFHGCCARCLRRLSISMRMRCLMRAFLLSS